MKKHAPFKKRYELKFIIPRELVAPIVKYISVYCKIDKHSEGYKDGFYPINSLYFDTYNYKFLNKKLLNVSNRYNIRIRSYGNTAKPPYFFEVKQRSSIFMYKNRALIENKNWYKMFDCSSPDYFFNAKEITDPNLKMFLMNVFLNNAAPKILVRYKRLAYLSEINQYARVTFDKDLCYRLENDYVINPDESKMVYFGGFYPTAINGNVLLELKCRNDMPVWMMDMIKNFNLTRNAFSKYASGMLEALSINSTQKNMFQLQSIYY
jgi:hypothetical protein